MPRPRFERADPALRTAVLDAAAAEFAERGYESASLNQILLAAGVSKGAFYYYFDDKADLAATVLERELASFLEDLEHLKTPERAEAFWPEVERLSARGMARLRASPRQRDLLSRLGTALGRDPQFMAKCGPFVARSQERLIGFWTRGQELGAVRTDLPVPLLLAMVQATKQALGNVLLPADRAPTPEEFERCARLTLDMLRRLAAPAAAVPEESP